MKRQTAMAAAAALLGVAALSACTNVTINNPAPEAPSASAESGDGHMMDDHSMHGAMGDVDADVHFLQMMIPHHQQALTMATLAESNGASPEVLALARQIAAAQGPEIEQMQAWLAEAGEPSAAADEGHDMGAHHDMAMDGMLTDEELGALEQAQGADFDRLFLTGMIQHHEGAIIMAEHVKEAGDDPRVAELADAIITAQKAEIAQMKQMLG